MKLLVFSCYLLCVTTECFPQEPIIGQDSIISIEKGFIAKDTLKKNPQTLKYDESEVRPISLSKVTIANLKKDNAFDYTEDPEQENWWTSFTRWIGELWDQFWKWLLGDYQANGVLEFIIRLLPYLIVIGILTFIIWLFYRLNPGAKLLKSKENPVTFFTEEEEIIRKKDIKNLIQKALNDKNYRLAVRYYYLLILKKLTDADLIEYEFDKTNSDYFSEIASEAINSQFKKVTNLYDYIWYGSFDVTETDYQKAQKSFITLENEIFPYKSKN